MGSIAPENDSGLQSESPRHSFSCCIRFLGEEPPRPDRTPGQLAGAIAIGASGSISGDDENDAT